MLGNSKPKPNPKPHLIFARSIPRGSISEPWVHNDPVRYFGAVSCWNWGSKGGEPVHQKEVRGTCMVRCDSETPSRNAWGSAIRRYPYAGSRPRFPVGVVHDGWGVPRSAGGRTWTDAKSRMVDADDPQKTTRTVMWRMGTIEGSLVAGHRPACAAAGIPTDKNRCRID